MAIYTEAQLESYLARINYPSPSSTSTSTSTSSPSPSRLETFKLSLLTNPLKTLTLLQRHHLSSIPWGNSAIHYSQHHSISTHPSAVFEKLVTRRLDGYCMENTNLLYGVLRSLGYAVYPAAGRVSTSVGDPTLRWRDVRFGPLGHMVLILTIEGARYMVDVGFGNNNPTSPLPLKENITTPNTPPTSMRLIREPLPEAVDQSQKFWIYQVNYNNNSNPVNENQNEGQNEKEKEENWHTMYAFSETETLPQDFAMMNFQTSKLPSSWFTQRVVCVQNIFEPSGSDSGELQPVGVYILAERGVKKRVAGRVEVVMRLENEDDRVRALERWFGIVLMDYEVQGIRGLGSELV
ncbi:arylamine N-acetyltransferase family protein [Aspergillus undulatus]|uniref:arylamine N-acetyltransferase family protein n=1 Tax=Aspergillus undulatus TaxID=1810928 RepID=UPI003CCC9AFF